MENRLANIETDLATVKSGVANLQENSATKADLAALKVGVANLQENSATKADLAVVRVALTNLQENSATKADLAKVEVHLLEKVDTMTWRFITWVTGVMGMGFAAVYYVARNVH
jgi:hypothetical protein